MNIYCANCAATAPMVARRSDRKWEIENGELLRRLSFPIRARRSTHPLKVRRSSSQEFAYCAVSRSAQLRAGGVDLQAPIPARLTYALTREGDLDG
jgi:hypothetical protein